MPNIYGNKKTENIRGYKSIRKKSHEKYIERHKYSMIPLIFVLCIIPFIVRMKEYSPNMLQYSWFPNAETHWDFFLFYKQWTLIIVAFIMAIMIIVKAYHNKKTIKKPLVLIPLGVYLLFCILSTIFSKYLSYTLAGSFEQFESIFALMGYGLIVYYAIVFVQSENDIKYIMTYLLASVFFMSLLGVFQYLGHDFFASEAGKNIIIPAEIRQNYDINFRFPVKTTYLTLYNPNYVGSYIALFIPLVLTMIFFQRKIYILSLQILIVIGLAISTIGSDSDSGMIAVAAVIILIPIFMWRNILKRWYIVFPAFAIIIVALVVIDKQEGGIIGRKIESGLRFERTKYNLSELRTEDDHVSFKYKGNTMMVSYNMSEDMNGFFTQTDEQGNPIEFSFDVATGKFTSMDVRFPGIVLNADLSQYGVFNIIIHGQQWDFYKDISKNTYYYINQYGKIDKIIEAPSSIFTGYEKFATSRGYLWSRTIPLLKDYIILGSGPDTFAMAFPQNDYMNLRLNNLHVGVLTKPHNMYLQIAVQTGLLSLVAFLIFYLMYFITSIRLYIRGRFTSYYAQVGVAIFISTIAYMITGLANDSSITTAPIFWALMGIGIAVNLKAKPLILEERESLRYAKLKKDDI